MALLSNSPHCPLHGPLHGPLQSRRTFLAGLSGTLGAVALGEQALAATRVSEIRLIGLDGKPATFLTSEQKLTVVWFVSSICPVVKEYLDRMEQLVQQFQPQGVRFLLVNANGNESEEQVQAFAAAVQMPVPIYLDRGHLLADAVQARLTPEAFLLNRQGELLYRGAVDDHKNPARVRVRPLALALTAGLTGRRPPYAEWRSIGCTIKRRSA